MTHVLRCLADGEFMALLLRDGALRMLLDEVSDAIVLFDSNGRVCLINEAAHRILGGDPWRLYGLSMEEIVYGQLGMPVGVAPRLRSGELIAQPRRLRRSVAGQREFRIQQLRLFDDQPGPTADVAPASALIIEDRRAVVRLRAWERPSVEAVEQSSGTGSATGAGPGLTTCAGLRHAMIEELRFAACHGECVGVLLCRVADADADVSGRVEGALRTGLWPARVPGRLGHRGVGDSMGQGPSTVDAYAELWTRLEAEGQHWCVLLPGASSSDCEAELLELRGRMSAAGLAHVRYGTACVRPKSAGPAGGVEACALELIEAAEIDLRMRQDLKARSHAERTDSRTVVGVESAKQLNLGFHDSDAAA